MTSRNDFFCRQMQMVGALFLPEAVEVDEVKKIIHQRLDMRAEQINNICLSTAAPLQYLRLLYITTGVTVDYNVRHGSG